MTQTIRQTFLLCFSMALLILTGLMACDRQENIKYPKGRELAGKYCGSCHRLPEPDALSTDLWRQILPGMGARLGFKFTQEEANQFHELQLLGLSPDSAVISKEDWEAIKAYYLANSPDSLPAFTTDISDEPLDIFEPRLIRLTGDAPAGSLVRFDSTGFWYGDALKYRLYFYDLQTDQRNIIDVTGSPSDMLIYSDGYSILTMGNIFPNDQYEGQLTYFSVDSTAEVLLDSLNRPVKVREADLNGDGAADLIICGFGYRTGSLSWFEKTQEGYREHILRALPGAINAEAGDFNGDGHTDILALMAQGQEGFYAYLGDGKGNFTEKLVYSFPSYYGSSWFELKDMNNDGRQDIIYANGDTGDYDYPALKPYHAVRILLQEEALKFVEATAFPVHGPFNSMAEDYDLDGDIDIAVTSYFPDYTNTPKEGFLLLENNGNLEFTARSLPESVWGNWLSADRADFDGDGDIDILLGNGPVIRSKVDKEIARIWQEHPNSVLLLENKSADADRP